MANFEPYMRHCVDSKQILELLICPYLIVFKIWPLFLKMIIFIICVCMCVHFACLEVYMYVGMCIYIHRRQCEPQVSSSISLFFISQRHSFSCTWSLHFSARQAVSKPYWSSCLCHLQCWYYRHVWELTQLAVCLLGIEPRSS